LKERERAAARLGGYVLAGGRSSRMGRDKARLPLVGQPLVAHAVAKLLRVTGEANILAGSAPGDAALQQFGPLVCDNHPGCGPMAGIEAALRHSAHEWNLILPVDVPFLPAAFLDAWVRHVLDRIGGRSPVALFRVGELPQPTVLLVRREVAPVLTAALGRGEFKVLPALQRATRELAPGDACAGESVPYILSVSDGLGFSDRFEGAGAASWQVLTDAQRRAKSLWFANLNTPEEFAEAERHLDALDRFD
jgi:molybdopterin-guanine dinucleotide biosynthesis protein A